jgi:hypothetical protein
VLDRWERYERVFVRKMCARSSQLVSRRNIFFASNSNLRTSVSSSVSSWWDNNATSSIDLLMKLNQSLNRTEKKVFNIFEKKNILKVNTNRRSDHQSVIIVYRIVNLWNWFLSDWGFFKVFEHHEQTGKFIIAIKVVFCYDDTIVSNFYQLWQYD